MGAIDWDDPIVTLTTLLSTELNSLANGSTIISAAINNETNEAMFMDMQLHLGSLNLSAQANPSVSVVFLESTDGGTTYDDGTAGATTSAHSPKAPAAVFPLRLGAGAEVKEAVVSMIPIPPGYFKMEIKNSTGVAFAATLNTLKYRTYKVAVA